jgi:hypothetical protein
MLSIIISSYQTKYFLELEHNIAQTCGIVYEIIKIDNPCLMGICQAYNQGAEIAKYDNLLFLHEDIEFKTSNWGEILIAYLKDHMTGCVGIAGSTYIPNAPVGWWFSKSIDFRYLLQNNRDYRTIDEDKNTILLDGVFIAIEKQKYEEFKFNESFTGFHAYDIDFSQRVSQKFQNLITSKILINHFSTGKPDSNWFFDIIKTRKNKPPTKKIDYYLENVAFVEFCQILKNISVSRYKKTSLFFEYLSPKYLGKKKIFKYITSQLFQIFQ